ncbi:MAG TPA: hypothetical protein VF483_07710 [Gemmatimonadaceae bacterium]
MTAAIYVAILIYAIKQVGEAKRLRRAQTRPFIVVDVEPGFLLYLTITNIGKTLARNVRFEFPRPLEAAVEKPWEVTEAPLLRNGVPSFPPGKRYRLFFDSFQQRVERGDLPMEYEVVVGYEDDEKHPYEDRYILDLNSIMHTSPEEKGLPELVKQTKEIATTLKKWTDGGRGLLVHARDRDEMERQQRAAMEQRRQQRAAGTDSGA